MLTTNQIPEEKTLSARALTHLRTTSRWVRFFGILGFISSIFTLIATFGGITGALSSASEEDGAALWLLIGCAVLVGMVIFSFYVSFVLFDYGSKTKQFVVNKDYESLAQSFKRQLTYWKLVGIMITIILAFYLLYFIFIIAITANAGR